MNQAINLDAIFTETTKCDQTNHLSRTFIHLVLMEKGGGTYYGSAIMTFYSTGSDFLIL